MVPLLPTTGGPSRRIPKSRDQILVPSGASAHSGCPGTYSIPFGLMAGESPGELLRSRHHFCNPPGKMAQIFGNSHEQMYIVPSGPITGDDGTIYICSWEFPKIC